MSKSVFPTEKGELSTTNTEEDVLSDDFQFTVERDVGLTIQNKGVLQETKFGLYVFGEHVVGSNGYPETDTYEYAQRLHKAIQHITSVTGMTDGRPVWFEQAAVCNNCEILYDATDRYVGEITCGECGSEFPRDGIMRATFPEKVYFREFVPFEALYS